MKGKKGMHMMPDGSMMKDSDHMGRALGRKTKDAMGRAMKMKKGGMADKTGRAVSRKTADVRGRAMRGK